MSRPKASIARRPEWGGVWRAPKESVSCSPVLQLHCWKRVFWGGGKRFQKVNKGLDAVLYVLYVLYTSIYFCFLRFLSRFFKIIFVPIPCNRPFVWESVKPQSAQSPSEVGEAPDGGGLRARPRGRATGDSTDGLASVVPRPLHCGTLRPHRRRSGQDAAAE